jgi:hypothetical protein
MFIERKQWTKRERSIADRGAYDAKGKLPNGRKRFCGSWTLRGQERVPGIQAAVQNARGRKCKYARLTCGCWGCCLCGPRKARRYQQSILRAVSQAKLTRLFTLTLDFRNIATTPEAAQTFSEHFLANKAEQKCCACAICRDIQERAIPHIRNCWKKLRVYLHRKFGKAPKYIAVLEFQKTTGLAHLHIIIDCYIEHAWAKKVWSSIGGGEHVHLCRIDAHRAAAYLSKYLSKELLLSAPEGTRRITCSQSIKLNPKKASEYEWVVIATTIEWLYELLIAKAEDVIRNAAGEIEYFAVRE